MKDSNFYAEASIAELYHWFADAAVGSSPTWVDVCRWVADSHALDDLLHPLPGLKRQPNLFLAALRFCGAPLVPGDELAGWVREHWDEVEQVVLTHATQTNEPGRCATLAPVLASIGEPLALIEVGMSAGLCLAPDRYGYRYHRHDQVTELPAPGHGAPIFDCLVSGAEGRPLARPEVVWRAGIDLNPLDPGDADDAAWLRALVWPDQPDRERRLARALAVTAETEVHRVSGDAVAELPALIDRAPAGATVVVMHSAVLAYFEPRQCAEFAALMARLQRERGVRWVSNEGTGVLPDVVARLGDRPMRPDEFLLALDGEPVAATGSHGQRLHWW